MVFTSAEFHPKTIQQASVHAPLGEKWRFLPARTVNLIDVHGLLPVILLQKPKKAFPLACFTVHKASNPIKPVCVLFVLGGVWVGVLTRVSPHGGRQSALKGCVPA